MVSRLVWKEFYEVRWWVVPVIIMPVVMIMHGNALTFRGTSEGGGPNSVLLWYISGLLMGALAYGRELVWDTPRFLYSRPLAWWHVWVAKVGVGAALFAASAVVSAVAYRLFCPTQYVALADARSLLLGAIELFLNAFTLFLIGFQASAVLLGLSATFCVLFGGALLFLIGLSLPGKVNYYWSGKATDMEAYRILLPVLPVFVSITVSPRLAQPVADRVKRYCKSLTAAVAVLIVYMFTQTSKTDSLRDYSWSPDGRHVIELRRRSLREEELLLHERSNGKSRRIDLANIAVIGWSPDSRQVAYLRAEDGNFVLKSVEVAASGPRQVHSSRLPPLPDQGWSYERVTGRIWSPDSRYIMFRVDKSRPRTAGQRQTPWGSMTIPAPWDFAPAGFFVFDRKAGALSRHPDDTWVEGRLFWLSSEEIASYDHYGEESKGAFGRMNIFNVRTGKRTQKLLYPEPALPRRPENMNPRDTRTSF